jgi:hypothetical protein
VASGAKGAAKLRDAKRNRLRADLVSLRNYVQTIATAQPTHAEAAAVIEDALMAVKKPSQKYRPPFCARNASVSGSVLLEARAVAKSATYFWQHSADQQTWIDAGATMRCKTVITGLTPARTYHFRFHALTRAGAVGFSQVVSLVVQ